MGKEHNKDLLKFLVPFPQPVQETALWLRDFVWDLYPDCNELIYDNYNALAFGWGLSDRLGDVFCSIAVYKSINFGFNRGNELADPKKLLVGNGNVYRYIKVHDKKDFPATYMKKLLKEAHANAQDTFKPGKLVHKGETIVKSISAKKRRPYSL
jgi:hypothetical protein